jgi:hypothetical protein
MPNDITDRRLHACRPVNRFLTGFVSWQNAMIFRPKSRGCLKSGVLKTATHQD